MFYFLEMIVIIKIYCSTGQFPFNEKSLYQIMQCF